MERPDMKMTRNLLILAVAACGSLSFGTTWSFNYNPTLAEQNSDGGKINNVNTSFNDATNQFKFEVNLGKTKSGGKTDGFWLAVNDGPNPKGHAGELALLYFDAFGPSGPTLTAYGYNGFNGDTSYKDGSPASGNQAPDKILTSLSNGSSWVNGLTYTNNSDGSRTLGFDINATAINGRSPMYPGSTPWTGLQFDNKIGMWLHTVNDLDAQYGADGFLTNWSYGEQGWLDFSNKDAVPEPASMIVLGGAAVLAMRKKFKKA